MTWLRDEAIVAGGLGPAESDRLWTRHIADSLLFGYGLDAADAVVDLGTGVGLPALPIAIAWPEVNVTAVDRSVRRTDLMNRAIRILDVNNVEIETADVTDVRGSYDRLTARAALPPLTIASLLPQLVTPSGIALVGLSHGQEPDVRDLMANLERMSVVSEIVKPPYDVLDASVTLLRMSRRV